MSSIVDSVVKLKQEQYGTKTVACTYTLDGLLPFFEYHPWFIVFLNILKQKQNYLTKLMIKIDMSKK